MTRKRNVLNWLRIVKSTRPGLNTILPLLKARDKVGRVKYGKPLTTHNGQNATQDLLEELLDAVMYAAQAHIENGGDNLAIAETGQTLRDCINLARRVAERMEATKKTP